MTKDNSDVVENSSVFTKQTSLFGRRLNLMSDAAMCIGSSFLFVVPSCMLDRPFPVQSWIERMGMSR